MSIWDTVSGFFGGGTTPGIQPGAGQPPKLGAGETPSLEEVSPVGHKAAPSLAEESARQQGIEPELKPIEVNYGEHSLIAPTLTKNKLDAEAASAAALQKGLAGASALAGMGGGGGGLAPGRLPGIQLPNHNLLDYYNRHQALTGAAQAVSGPTGLFDMINFRR